MADASWYAHTAGASGRWQTMREHLEGVACRAEQFASAFGASEEARVAGLLHDAGKYSPLFQKRLKGELGAIDHWSPGAWLAVKDYRCIAAALAIAGHHVGLGDGSHGGMRRLAPDHLAANHPHGMQVAETDLGEILSRMRADGLEPEAPAEPLLPYFGSHAAHMLDVRMLFSALVDADFLDTEAHFSEERGAGATLEPEAALVSLMSYVERVRQGSNASDEIDALRRQLMEQCAAAGRQHRGLLTLTAPTGSGKTLAMLRFALEQARAFGLRRVIYVAPYLSIIEQTARVYREALSECCSQESILEHHSLSGVRRSERGGPRDRLDPLELRERQLTENWDAPFILTTTVQILESLFADRPGACRKLHRIAGSVVLFDEAQNLPIHVVLPTLIALARLVERYGVTVVFATATQPAFGQFDSKVAEAVPSGWRPAEIVANTQELFNTVRRVKVHWPQLQEGGVAVTTWEELSQRMLEEPQIACVVNMKRHAANLALGLRASGAEGLLHLSTNMCSAHRLRVLDEARERLETGAPCRLVSTQCIEAGVDVDFPVLMRAFGPLEAIAQAAGRCNRHGQREVGHVTVFWPEADEGKQFPSPLYETATHEVRELLRVRSPDGMDLGDSGLFNAYYSAVYDLTRPTEMRRELLEAIKDQRFDDVARRYRVIEQDPVNVLVPYAPLLGEYENLADEVRQSGITARWVRRARALSVTLYRPKSGDPVWGFLEPLPIVGDRKSDDWYIWSGTENYDDLLGLVVPSESSVLIA